MAPLRMWRIKGPEEQVAVGRVETVLVSVKVDVFVIMVVVLAVWVLVLVICTVWVPLPVTEIVVGNGWAAVTVEPCRMPMQEHAEVKAALLLQALGI